MQCSLDDISVDLGGKFFGKLVGKFSWLVQGSIGIRYNSVCEGVLCWQGVIFNVFVGILVWVVYAGWVVFVDWLRGYGLFIIVDHGNGYLTLYGYNQSLLWEVGEWVFVGDSLVLAGNFGGNCVSGLYFEICHWGKVVNFIRWCNRCVILLSLVYNIND